MDVETKLCKNYKAEVN